MAQTQLDKVLCTGKDHTTGGRDGGASRSSDGRLDMEFSVPGAILHFFLGQLLRSSCSEGLASGI